MKTIALAFLMAATPAAAAPALIPTELWFSPTDDVTQHGADFHDVFAHTERWSIAASHTRTVSIPVRYFLKTPPEIVQAELASLRNLHLRLNVVILALGVDKKVCGDGIEGYVWPGENAAEARALKALGIEPDSISLDLPLTDGHIMKRPQHAHTCELSIHDTAVITARTVGDWRAVFPKIEVIDIEVPTGIPLAQWTETLETWLSEYQAVSGKQFEAVLMDAWWKFPWQPTVRATADILARRGIRSGILIDESGDGAEPATAWIGAARNHVCELRQAGIHLDYFVVASWSNMNVKSLPDRDPATLSGLLAWIAGRPTCSP